MHKYIAILLLVFSGAAFADISGKVVAVTDGDTIKVLTPTASNTKFAWRVLTHQRRHKHSVESLLRTSAKYVAGQNAKVEYEKRDRYGRIIGKLLMYGQDVNLLQIKDGFAWRYKFY
jgi:endonuclease YncB( thermonuclease family)